MSAVSVQTVLAWLNYWALPPEDSYSQWEHVFDNIPMPPPPPSTYNEAALWISANYYGPPVPPPRTDSDDVSAQDSEN